MGVLQEKNQQTLLPLAEAAKRHGVSKDYLRFLIFKGKLKGEKLGRNWVTTDLWLEEYFGSLGRRNGKSRENEADREEFRDSDISRFREDIPRSRENDTVENGFRFSRIAGAVAAFMLSFAVGAYGMNLAAELSAHRNQQPTTNNRQAVLSEFKKFKSLSAEALQKTKRDLARLEIPAPARVGAVYVASVVEDKTGALSYLTSRLRALGEAAEKTRDIFVARLRELLLPGSTTIVRRELGNQGIREEDVLSTSYESVNESANYEFATTTEDVSKSQDFEISRPEPVREIVERREEIIPADFTALKIDLLSSVESLNQAIRNQVDGDIASLRSSLSQTSSRVSSTVQMVTVSQKIDNLDSLDITNGINIVSGGISVTQGNLTFTQGNIVADNITAREGIRIASGDLILSSGNITLSSGNTSISSNSTTTIPSSAVNAYSIATSTTATPFLTFDTQNSRIGIGTTTPGQTFSVAGSFLSTGNANIMGSLTIGDTLTVSNTALTVSATTTSSNQFTITASPSTAHTFASWSIGDTGASATTSALVVNASSAASDTNLLGLLVNNSVKFLVDAEGDVFANSLTTAGSVTTGSSTNASLLIEGSLYVGDASTDLFSINSGNIVYNNRATSTIPSSLTNAFNIATSSAQVPFLTFDTDNYRIGIGTTSPSATLAIGGAGSLYAGGNITALTGLGAGVSTTTSGALETTGPSLLGDVLNVTGATRLNSTFALTGAATLDSTLSVTGSTTLSNFGGTGNIFLGDAATDQLTLNASTTAVNALGVLGNAFLGDASSDQLTINATTTLANNAGILGFFFIGDANTDQLTVSATSTFTGGITASGGLSLTGGGLTVANNATVSGDATVSGVSSFQQATSTFLGVTELLTVQGTGTSTFSNGLRASTLNITSSSATSTFANGIQLSGGCFVDLAGSCVVNPWTVSGSNLSYTSGNVGIGTTSPGTTRLAVEHSDVPLAVDRTDADGGLVAFRRLGVTKGSISVSGETVSYNAFTGSHYAWTDESIERGMLATMTGENRRLEDQPDSEPLYGIKKSTVANDPAILGGYLALLEPSKPVDNSNPHLVAAVGNGEMYVVDMGVNLEIGDYLISSGVSGHAMLEDGTYSPAYVIARVAEPVDWNTVTETVNDNGTPRKHKKISVLFESYKLYANLSADSSLASGQTNAWSVDQTSGKVNVSFYGDINMQGNRILDVGKITGYLGKWSIDADGTLIAVKIITEEMIAEKIAVNQSATFGSATNPIGFTIYDEVTKEPYCLKISNGAVLTAAGICGASNTQNTPPSEQSSEAGQAETENTNGETASTTPTQESGQVEAITEETTTETASTTEEAIITEENSSETASTTDVISEDTGTASTTAISTETQ